MGVWIEMYTAPYQNTAYSSHPLWVCGLKYELRFKRRCYPGVTPFMGVWIEIGIQFS